MDPDYSLQDVVRCHLCETPVLPLHCVICNIHLCEDCQEKHLSDESKEHKVVKYEYRGSNSVSSKKHQVQDVLNLDPEYSLQDVVQCHLCETKDSLLYCDICHQYTCQECKGEHLSDESKEHKLRLHRIISLDPEYIFQDVVRCHLCQTPVPTLHCGSCKIHLCENCEGKHLLDETNEHKVVPFKYRGSLTKCPKHSTEICIRYCAKCDIPVCSLCVSSLEHQTHDVVDILKSLQYRKHVIQRDLQDLEEFIYTKYQEILSHIPIQKAEQNENSKTLTIAINKHGDDLHREIDIFIQKLKSELLEIDSKLLAVLQKQEDEIMRTNFNIAQSIANIEEFTGIQRFQSCLCLQFQEC